MKTMPAADAPQSPATPPEENLDETVRRFIRRYGDNALAEAQRRLAELKNEGDEAGAGTWAKVAAAIAATNERGSSKVH